MCTECLLFGLKVGCRFSPAVVCRKWWWNKNIIFLQLSTLWSRSCIHVPVYTVHCKPQNGCQFWFLFVSFSYRNFLRLHLWMDTSSAANSKKRICEGISNVGKLRYLLWPTAAGCMEKEFRCTAVITAVHLNEDSVLQVLYKCNISTDIASTRTVTLLHYFLNR